MVSEREIQEMLPKIGLFVAAVDDVDSAAVERIYRELEAEFGVDGQRAVAVLCAELVLRERDALRQVRAALAREQAETEKFAAAYLDQKRRVGELRSILDHRAAQAPERRAA